MLRVRLPAFFASALFIPGLPDFFEAHARLDLQLDTHDPRPAVHPPTTDLSILLLDAPPAGLTSARLFSLSLIAVCARQHAAAVARLGREVFGTLGLIVHQSRPYDWASWAVEAGLETPEANYVIELDTMSAVVRAAERGVGVALVPNVLCESWFRSGALVRVFSVQHTTREAYFAVCRAKDAERPDVKALFRWVVTQFQRPDEARWDRLPQVNGNHA
jgi:DNA-binding transcriptional LysR family regulator